MAKTLANEPINPILDSAGNGCFKGLSKREYFAAMAMQGLLVNYQRDDRFGNHPGNPIVAEMAVEQADALMKALNEEKQ